MVLMDLGVPTGMLRSSGDAGKHDFLFMHLMLNSNWVKEKYSS